MPFSQFLPGPVSKHVIGKIVSGFLITNILLVKPKLISGEDAAVSTVLFKGKIGNGTKLLNAGMRSYAVIHDGITYPFSFSDDSAKFDSPENTKIREHILNSIRFTNDTSP